MILALAAGITILYTLWAMVKPMPGESVDAYLARVPRALEERPANCSDDEAVFVSARKADAKGGDSKQATTVVSAMRAKVADMGRSW